MWAGGACAMGGAWLLQSHRKYVWSGWLLIAELDGMAADNIVRKYAWGLDLAGLNGSINSLEAAGGIGGLVAVQDFEHPTDPNDPFGSYTFQHDANGNVTQVIDLPDNPAATTQPCLSPEHHIVRHNRL
jgi:hypothetical protein